MGTGIITNGTNVFTDIVGKLGNITTEFVPYIIYIGIALIGINLTIYAVKYILNYLKYQSENTFGDRRINNRTVRVRTPEEDEILQQASDERDIEKEMYQDYQDYIYKHGKYKDGDFPTQEERFKRIQERKSKHKEYDWF